MSVLEIVKVIAILSSGLLAGILFGDRMGATFARPSLAHPVFYSSAAPYRVILSARRTRRRTLARG